MSIHFTNAIETQFHSRVIHNLSSPAGIFFLKRNLQKNPSLIAHLNALNLTRESQAGTDFASKAAAPDLT